MKHLRSVLSLLLAILIISPLIVPQSAAAQSRRDWRAWYQSEEGEIDDEVEERATSRRGISSATQRKIDQLDDDEVEAFPIPILLGVTLASITSDFGDPRDGGARSHEGQDILAPRGAYVVSPTEAVVTRTGSGSSAGNYVYTANPGGETFAYMHLDEVADDLSVGDVLEPGDLIGYVGNTGNAIGGVTHLHFEVRENRRASDPYPRLEGEFTLRERIDALEKILEDADDEEEEAEALVATYRSFFIAAQAQGIELPEAIADVLGSAAINLPRTITRDLELGAAGADVTALQAFLIGKNAGSAAKALAATGATGYFGALTKAAVIEYQTTEKITPAAGYVGPLTRARIAADVR